MIEKESKYSDVYMVIVPHGVKLKIYCDRLAPNSEVMLVSSPKNFNGIDISLQGQKLKFKK